MKPALSLTLAILVLTTTGLHAAAKMSGASRWKVSDDNKTVTFGCDRISNPSPENATGTLLVQLWALNAPYVSGTISGRVLGSYKLGPMEHGAYYNAPNKTVPCSIPTVRKSYVICLTVSEYKQNGYVMADFHNFSAPATLGVPVRLFTMTGPMSWQTSYEGGTIDFSVAKISHTRTTQTGSLRLAAWACKAPYSGKGTLNGYELGHVDKKALEPGYAYTNIKNTAVLKRPPAGNYYVTLVLEEFNGKEYVIVASMNTDKTSFFAAAQ